jgi:hypothetical protein
MLHARASQDSMLTDIPQDDGIIITRQSERLAVRRKGHTLHITSMAFERRAEGLAGGDIPQDDGLVPTPRSERLAGRAGLASTQILHTKRPQSDFRQAVDVNQSGGSMSLRS